MGGYLVAVKPSARRINGTAGDWVRREGARRAFGSKAEARVWAAAASDGDGAVRVQDAAPNDPTPVDGYLVADPVRRRPGAGEPPGEPTTFDSFSP